MCTLNIQVSLFFCMSILKHTYIYIYMHVYILYIYIWYGIDDTGIQDILYTYIVYILYIYILYIYICNNCWYIWNKSAQYVNKIRQCNDNLIDIIQNLQICYLKFHAVNDDFQAILKLSRNLNTLILDKVWNVVIATTCQNLSRISVFELSESFSIAWKSSFMVWNFMYSRYMQLTIGSVIRVYYRVVWFLS